MNNKRGWFVYAPSKKKPRKLYQRYAEALRDAQDVANKEATDVYVLEATAFIKCTKHLEITEFGLED